MNLKMTKNKIPLRELLSQPNTYSCKVKTRFDLSSLAPTEDKFVPQEIIPSVNTDSPLLEKYKSLFPPHKFFGVTVYKKGVNDYGKTILSELVFLDSPKPFAQGLNKLSSILQDLCSIFRIDMWSSFNWKASELEKNASIKDTQIKGIIGQGAFSTAFVTADNDVLKFSKHVPVCPTAEHMIDGVDLPIKNRFFVESHKQPVFIEPLAEK